MPVKLNNDEFIKRSEIIHNGKYSYDKCKYIGNRVKVIITCDEHGDFIQLPHNHLKGKGCQFCGGSKRHTKETFIEKSKIKHNNKYDYYLVKYLDSRTKVKISCPIHGVFEQSPENHMKGSGCHECGGSNKSTNQKFISKSRKIHHNEYDYSKVEYKNNKTKVIITCNIHGSFEITPSNHLKGVGCSKCVGKNKSTTEEFMRKSNIKHDFLYNYEFVKYTNCKSEVDIMCEKHGLFRQKPSSHLSGRGCPNCQSSNGELKIEFLLKSNNIKFVKQYAFDDLKFKKKLKFDFAVFNFNDNLKCLIEYNGRQHYEQNEYFGGEKQFELTLKRDLLKIEYCNNKNINIFTIRYDEDVDTKFSEIISYLKN